MFQSFLTTYNIFSFNGTGGGGGAGGADTLVFNGKCVFVAGIVLTLPT